MKWFDGGLLASHAKKNKIKSHTGGVNKNRATRYKDPERYKGGKGSKQRRKLVKFDGEVKTNNDFLDKRSNTSNKPVYVKITHYRRPNPMSNEWVEVGDPRRIVISYTTYLKEHEDKFVEAIERRGNFVNIKADDDYPDYHNYVRIMDGDRLREECREYALPEYPLISDF